MPYLGKSPATVPVTAEDIPDNSITAAKLVDGSITIDDIGANAVGNSEMANDAVGIPELSASGTASNTTFLRGDNAWAVVDTNLVADTSPQLGGNLDLNSNNITGTGGIPAGNLTGNIAAARLTIATTQAESDNSTKLATTAYVTSKITTLIGGAPSTLNDLNELALAINDDSNYNSTLTTALATKLPLAGGAMTGAITTNSTFDGVDIATRDGVLTSTTATAAAALPKAGGAMTGNVTHADNVKAQFGTGTDFEIYSGGEGVKLHANNGVLEIEGDSVQIWNEAAQEAMATFTANGAVELYHNAVKKLETTPSAVQFYGNLMADDGYKLMLGTGTDLQIYHDGSNSYIDDAGTGSLILRADGSMQFKKASTTEYMARFDADGAATLYHNGSAKIATTATGINVTGAVNSTGEMRITNPSATSQLYLYGASGQKSNIILNEYGVRAWHIGAGTYTSGQFSISDGTTERMRIDASGNVGIGASSAGGKLEIHQEQVTGQFDRDCFLRLHPSAHTNSGGFTNMMFGTSTTNNYGVAIGGLRAGTDNAPSFRINMLNDSVSGFNALNIDSTGAVTMPAQPYFVASMRPVSGGATWTVTAEDTALPFNYSPVNVGSHFSTSNYRFTAPVAGVYGFAAGFITNAASASARMMFFVNNASSYSSIQHGINGGDASGTGSQTASAYIKLAANDYVDFRSQSGELTAYNSDHSSFTGILIG